MLHPRLATLLAVVSLACGLYFSTSAQTVTGSMEGRVIDQTGAVIPGAKIAIHNVETGQERVLTTNADGFYRAPFLPLGSYRVIASSQGFANVTQENIQVEGHQVALRADLFNAFNHVQYGFPVLDLANANFGRLNGTSVSYSPRNVQFSLRYVF
jgi:hypothetical protein